MCIFRRMTLTHGVMWTSNTQSCCKDNCQNYDNHIQVVKASSLFPLLCLDVTLHGFSCGTGKLKITIITWAGKRTGLFQYDPLVSVDGQLQAAAQLLVHQAPLAVTGAVGHEAGQVSVAHAVSTHHTLWQDRRRRRKREDDELPQRERGVTHEATALVTA